MARRVVTNELTGETFVFDDAWNDPDGRVRQFEFTMKPNNRVPAHAHPATAQVFEVLSGALSVQIGNRALTLKAGERGATERGEYHAQWNEGSETVHAIERYDPPLAIEPFFTAIPHAMASKNLLKLAVLWAEFGHISRPRSIGLRAFVVVFGSLGRLAGLSGWYKPLLCEAGLH